MQPVFDEEFGHLWKQTKFADFEREASFNALSKVEQSRIEEQLSDPFYERISGSLFDASDEDDNDKGLINAAVYQENLDKLTELVKLKASGQLTEEEYNKLKLPLLEAMYEQLKD